MIKSLLTAAALLVVPGSAVASTIHDFNPNISNARSLDSQCYTTHGESKVCFYRLQGETFNVAIKQASNPEYPHVFTINCDTGRYKGYGPMSNQANAAFATAFCESGRW